MLGAVRRVARSPYLANCVRYGTFFCGAELVQQLALRKYGPWSQVDNNVYSEVHSGNKGRGHR